MEGQYDKEVAPDAEYGILLLERQLSPYSQVGTREFSLNSDNLNARGSLVYLECMLWVKSGLSSGCVLLTGHGVH